MRKVALKRVCQLVTDPGSDQQRPFVALEHVAGGTGNLVENFELPQRGPAAGIAAVEPDDVLFGKLRPYLAKTLRVREPMFASTELLALRPVPGIDSRWLHYLVMSDQIVRWAVATSDGSKMPRTNWSVLSEYRVTIPEPNSQRAIADFLDAETTRIDALIAKKRTLARLMRQRLRVQADSVLASVSDPVPLRRLISRLTSGPRGWASHVADDGAAFLTIANVRRDDVELNLDNIVRVTAPDNAEARRTRVREGDVLLSITADIGSVGVIRNGLGETYVSQHLALMTPDRCLPDWLAFALWGSAAQRQLDSARYGGTKTQLALEDVADIRVPSPPRSDQAVLVRKLMVARQQHLETVQKLNRQIELLTEHRQALITAAVTGRLEVSGTVES